jgi:hypothetical protein
MAHRFVPLDGVESRYAEAPRVTVVTRGEGRPGLVLDFISSELGPSGEFRVTRLTFERVLEYHWTDDQLGLQLGNEEDVEFDLIEITDSELIRRRLEEGFYSQHPAGQRLGGVLEESDIHHYRICFDHHGTYDVVCVDVDAQTHISTDRDA